MRGASELALGGNARGHSPGDALVQEYVIAHTVERADLRASGRWGAAGAQAGHVGALHVRALPIQVGLHDLPVSTLARRDTALSAQVCSASLCCAAETRP